MGRVALMTGNVEEAIKLANEFNVVQKKLITRFKSGWLTILTV